MSRLTVLAAALLALAAVVLLPDRAAQAQTTTTVWSATLNVDLSTSYSGCSNASFSVGNWDNCSSSTVLSDDDFEYNGTTYTITGILQAESTIDRLLIQFSSAGSAAKTALSGLTLNAAGSAFAISDATVIDFGGSTQWLRWTSEPGWSDGDSVSLSLTQAVDNTRPAKPTGFNATPGNQRAILSWTDPSDSTITKWQYRQKTTGAYGGWQDFTSSATTTSHTVTSLTNGTAYTFQIRAVDAGGNGANSDEKIVTPAVPVRGVTLSKTALTVAEGGTATYTIRLNTLPTFGAHGFIRVSFSSGDTSAVTLSGPGGSSRVTFRSNNWHIPQTVTVTGVEDADAVSEMVTITHGWLATLGSNYAGLTLPSVTVTVTDNETPTAGPTVSGSPSITSSVPSNQNGHYKIGDDIEATLTFSAAIAVTGTPKLKIDVGGTEKTADCARHGTETTKLVCTYTVASGDADANGIAIGSNKLTLPTSATIKNSGGTADATLTHSALAQQSGHKVDGVRPTITGFTMLSTAGTYGISGDIHVIANFGEDVTVTGTPTLAITVGSNSRTATYTTGGSFGKGKVFAYGVQAGEVDTDGISIASGSITLAGGATIKDNAGNAATLSHTGMPTQSAHKVDGVAPSTPSNFKATAGNMQVTLSWSDPSDTSITKYQYRQKAGTGSYGNWQAITGSGATTTSHTVTSLSNGTAYTFMIRVFDAGFNDADSAEASATPAVAPTVSGSPAITSSVPSGQDGKYKIGDDIEATVTFGAAIAVSGTPKLKIDVGGTEKTADCARHSSENTKLVCTYTVASGDADADGIAIGVNKLTLPSGATIRASTGTTAATLTHSALTTQSSHKVDGVRPTISGYAISTTPTSGGTYAAGQNIAVRVTFSEAVTLAGGNPSLKLQVGSSEKTMGYNSRPGTAVVEFLYTVANGDTDTDGVSVGTNKLTLPSGGTIRDAAGNDATLTHSALTAQSGHKVDTTAPSAPSTFAAASGNARVTLSWSNPGDATIAKYQYRQKEGTGNYGSWQDFTSSATTTSHTVTGLTNGTAYAFRVRAVDAAGNLGAESAEATETPAAPTGPTVTGSPAITSSVPSGQDGKYRIGDDIEATVTFGAAIAVTGTPKLAITVGSAAKSADCAAHSSDNKKLVCTYTVVEGDEDTMGIGIGSNKLTAPTGASIKNTGGTADANLNHSALTQQSSHKVDGVRPTVTGIVFLPANASTIEHGQGQPVFAQVTFSEAVTLTGAPTFAIRVGANQRSAASYTPGSTATARNFRYSVQANEEDLDGISADANSLTVPTGASIRDAAGNDATLTHDAVPANAAVKVDAKRPAAPTGFTATVGNMQVTLNWSDPGDESIAKYQYQQKAGTGSYGSWTNIPNSDKDTTSHTVSSLNNGTLYTFKIRASDVRGNQFGPASAEASATPAVPTGPTVSGSPAITSSVPTGQDGHYKIGDAIEATVTFSAAIAVSTAVKPRLEITVGSAGKAAECAAHGTDNKKLVCAYTVASGDADADGIAIGSNKLTLPTGATIRNSGGTVDATLTHSALTQQSAHKVDGVAPSAPSNFTATAGNTQVTLDWSNPNDASIAKYQYKQKSGGGNYPTAWSEITGSGAATTSHTVTGLSNGTAYTFKVRAVDAATNEGAESAEASATPRATTTVPPAPRNMSAIGWSESHITVYWQPQRMTPAGQSPVTGHVLQVSADGGTTWSDLATLGANVSNYQHTGLSYCQMLCMAVLSSAASLPVSFSFTPLMNLTSVMTSAR